MNQRRKIDFDSLEEGLRDAENLLASGYHQLGKWNLAQCCGHLENWLTYPLDGFPKPGLLMGCVLWIMKKTLAPAQLRDILQKGFKPGLPTMPASVPAANSKQDSDAVESLKTAVARFNAHNGELHSSPLFGYLDKDKLLQLHLRHFEHHLSFFEKTG